jgi:hypothetical protein
VFEPALFGDFREGFHAAARWFLVRARSRNSASKRDRQEATPYTVTLLHYVPKTLIRNG